MSWFRWNSSTPQAAVTAERNLMDRSQCVPTARFTCMACLDMPAVVGHIFNMLPTAARAPWPQSLLHVHRTQSM